MARLPRGVRRSSALSGQSVRRSGGVDGPPPNVEEANRRLSRAFVTFAALEAPAAIALAGGLAYLHAMDHNYEPSQVTTFTVMLIIVFVVIVAGLYFAILRRPVRDMARARRAAAETE